MFFRFNITATRGRFMEPPLRDSWEEFIAAYSYEHAANTIRQRLIKAGWRVVKIVGHRIVMLDVRDQCDHVTT